MATSTIKKMLKSKEFSVTITSGQTGSVITGIHFSRIVSVVLLKRNDDLFYDPIIYYVWEDGHIECRTTSINHNVTQPRTYVFLVWYI